MNGDIGSVQVQNRLEESIVPGNNNAAFQDGIDFSSIESFTYIVIKRCFDIAFSILALIVMAFPMLLIACLVRISSHGPIFFKQKRMGKNGKVFEMFKFRTMQMNEDSDRTRTTENDMRRTKLGIFLRKTSLDELPQFINVLKGEMSVVGPRPEVLYFAQCFIRDMPTYDFRHSGNVGITGFAQINGLRGETSIQKRLEYDLYYLQNWSFLFDLKIIVLTIFRMLVDENAY